MCVVKEHVSVISRHAHAYITQNRGAVTGRKLRVIYRVKESLAVTQQLGYIATAATEHHHQLSNSSY